MIKFKTPYNFKPDRSTALKCKDPSLAQQQFTEDCDINTIVDRFHLTGEVPTVDRLPTFGDFTGVFDFQTAMNAIRNAEESFMELPAKLRARFHNSPQEFLEFCSDDENHAEARKLGLLKPEATPPTTPPSESNLDDEGSLPEPKKGTPSPKPPTRAKKAPETDTE